jgi:hypothetical protein
MSRTLVREKNACNDDQAKKNVGLYIEVDNLIEKIFE